MDCMSLPHAAMPSTPNARERYKLLVQGATFFAVIGAFAWGFDGGMRIAGPLIGVAMGLNMGFFAGLLVGYLADKILGAKPGR